MRSISRAVPLTTTGLAVAALAALALAACGSSGSSGGTGNTGAAVNPASASPAPAAASQAESKDNGIASASLDDVVEQSTEAADSSKSVHVTGTLHDSGKTVTLNLRVQRNGPAYGSLNYDGAPLQILADGTAFYLRSTPAGWQKFMADNGAASEGPAVAAAAGNRWIKGTKSSPQFSSFSTFTDEGELLESLLPDSSDLDGAAKSGTATDGGVPVAVLKGADGTLYEVATTGKPYPMALTGKDSDGSGGSLHFDSWDQPVRVTTPAAADTIDLSRVSGF